MEFAIPKTPFEKLPMCLTSMRMIDIIPDETYTADVKTVWEFPSLPQICKLTIRGEVSGLQPRDFPTSSCSTHTDDPLQIHQLGNLERNSQMYLQGKGIQRLQHNIWLPEPQ